MKSMCILPDQARRGVGGLRVIDKECLEDDKEKGPRLVAKPSVLNLRCREENSSIPCVCISFVYLSGGFFNHFGAFE